MLSAFLGLLLVGLLFLLSNTPHPPVSKQSWEKSGSPFLYSALWLSRLQPKPLPKCPSSSSAPRIPKIVHFIYGLAPQVSQVDGSNFANEFTLLHALSVRAASVSQNPDTIYFHYNHLPAGKYWDAIKHLLTLVHINRVPHTIYGQKVEHIAHQASS